MKRTILGSLIAVLFISSLSFGQFATGQKAPDFTLPDIDGNYVTLSQVLGDGPVYINFWATWCGPCKKEIPHLVDLYNEYKDRGFKVLGVSTDNSRTVGKVKSFVQDRGMNFTILLDSNQEVFSRKYKGRGIPYGFLLDNNGNIIWSVIGLRPGFEKTIAEKIEPYLKPAPDDKSDVKKAEDKSPEKSDKKEETQK